MRCEDLTKKFVSGEDLLSEEELLHLSTCKTCKKSITLAKAALNRLEEADVPSFNPYFTSIVMSKIERRNEAPVSNKVRYALVVSVLVTLLIGSLTVYIASNNGSAAQTYDLLSFNDSTQQPTSFDK